MGIAILYAVPVQAYVGPGAGLAVASFFGTLLLTFVLVFFILLTWPVRWLLLTIKRRRHLKKNRVKQVVIVGLDGQDPELTRQFMDEGLLPNFQKLMQEGCFTELDTTLLAESPVGWSSFQTGCNPGRHRIYDFLVPNRKSHLPQLSSAQVTPNEKTLSIGKYRIPLGKPHIEVGRKSQPFWKTLGEHGVFSSILRVPITFPPEKFRGSALNDGVW